MAYEIGQELAVRTNVGLGEYYYKILKISRLTKTQVVLEDGTKYHKKNGRVVGHSSHNSWGTVPYISAVTDKVLEHNAEYREKQRRYELVQTIRRTDLFKLPTSVMMDVVQTLRENGALEE